VSPPFDLAALGRAADGDIDQRGVQRDRIGPDEQRERREIAGSPDEAESIS
jgi:hypothetical protein